MKFDLGFFTWIYVLVIDFGFSKIIQTDLGLISLSTIGFTLVYLNFKKQRSS